MTRFQKVMRGLYEGRTATGVAERNDEKSKHWRGLSSTIALRAAPLLSMDFVAGCGALKKQSTVIERIDCQLMLRHAPLVIGRRADYFDENVCALCDAVGWLNWKNAKGEKINATNF